MKKVFIALALVLSTSSFADLALPANVTKVITYTGKEAFSLAASIQGDWKSQPTRTGNAITYKVVRPVNGLFELFCVQSSQTSGNSPMPMLSVTCTLKTSLNNKPVPVSLAPINPAG